MYKIAVIIFLTEKMVNAYVEIPNFYFAVDNKFCYRISKSYDHGLGIQTCAPPPPRKISFVQPFQLMDSP